MTFNTMRGLVTGVLMGLLVIAFLVLAGGSMFTPQPASAQVNNTLSANVVAPTSCVIFSNNFGYGAYDYSSNGAVSGLQTFLNSQGYFNSAYLGTGHYGSITARAVAQFQASHGIPATGFMGPLTRAAVQQITCGGGTNPTTPPSQSVSLYNESPSSGAVGTTVTLTGFGFTNSNTVLMDGNVAASNVPITSSIAISCTTNPSCHGGINQSITFTVPSALAPYCAPGYACPQYMRLLTPGSYQITVLNSNGTSNALTFTVTSGSTGNNQQLSISGLDAPASLPLGTTGTWTVHALSNGQGNLHYSVVWGDENVYTSGNSIVAPQNTTAQSTATFTHAYARSGNYTPVFTVTDDFGHTVNTSNTVVITPLY